MSKIETEKQMVAAMIRLYCHAKGHSRNGTDLCQGCAELLSYAHKRLERCKFGNAKPSCTRCPVHCYKPAMREQIRQVMRYSGPRMLLHNPVLAIRHLWDFLMSKIKC